MQQYGYSQKFIHLNKIEQFVRTLQMLDTALYVAQFVYKPETACTVITGSNVK